MFLIKNKNIPLKIVKRKTGTLISLSLVISFLFCFLTSQSNKSDWWQSADLKKANTLFDAANLCIDNEDNLKAIEYLEKAAKLFKSLNKYDDYSISIMLSGICYHNINNYQKAYRYLNEAKEVAEEKLSEKSLLLSRIFSTEAYFLYSNDHYIESIKMANKSVALRIEQNGENDSMLTYPYYSMGASYCKLGKFEIALEYYSKSLNSALLQSNKANSQVSSCLTSIATILWAVGDFDKSIEYYKKSLKLINSWNGRHVEKAYTYIAIATMYLQIGDYKNALENLLKAEKNNNLANTKDVLISNLILFNKAQLLYRNNDFSNAIVYYQKALNQFEMDSIKKEIYIYQSCYYIGKSYAELGNTSKSLEYFKKSIKISKLFELNDEKLSYHFLARTYEAIGDLVKADSLFNEAIKYYKGLKSKVNLARCYVNYSQLCALQQDYSKAIIFATNAKDIFKTEVGEKNTNTSNAYNTIAELYIKVNDYDKALVNFQLSLVAGVKNFKGQNSIDNPEARDISADIHLLKPLKGKAYALHQKALKNNNDTSLLSASLKCYSLAIASIEKLKLLYGNTESSKVLLADENKTYDDAVAVASELYAITNKKTYFDLAFCLAEKSKSSLLLSVLRNNQAMEYAGIPVEIQNFEKKLGKQTDLYQQLINDENLSSKASEKKISYWNNQILKLNTQHQSMVSYLEEFYPSYYNLKFNTSVLNTDSVQQRLSGNEALVEYVKTNDRIYSFVITNKSARLVSTPIDSTFDLLLSAYLHEIKKSSSSTKNFCVSSHNLYKTLLESVKKEIANKALIIIPDEELYALPFETMLIEKADTLNSGYKNLPYLITKSSVSYAGSATLLYGPNQSSTSETLNLLAFAPGYDNAEEYKSSDEETRQYVSTLKPLAGAKDEVESIHEIVGGTVFSGNNATLAKFEENYSRYSVLHFAMHTLINNENPMKSSLVFNTDENGDCLLSSEDIFGMKFNAKLAVLSACNTGIGKVKKGEGMLCLARSFMYAGCPDLVMTLWDIDDKSGATIMKSFYSYLSQGMSKNEALQQAKIDFISGSDNIKSSPFYWAGYINFGNFDPICSTKLADTSVMPSELKFLYLLIPLAGLFAFRKKIANKVRMMF